MNGSEDSDTLLGSPLDNVAPGKSVGGFSGLGLYVRDEELGLQAYSKSGVKTQIKRPTLSWLRTSTASSLEALLGIAI